MLYEVRLYIVRQLLPVRSKGKCSACHVVRGQSNLCWGCRWTDNSFLCQVAMSRDIDNVTFWVH